MSKRARRQLTIGFLLLSCCMGINAQCATGVNTGGGNCVPPDAPGMPDYQPSTPPPPRAVWADSWGAIAFDTVDVSKGVTVGQESKAKAIDVAMDECSSSGATHCKVVLTYYNQCAAVAWGANSYGAAGSATEAEAKASAIDKCASGGPKCKIVYTACSLAKRIR